MTTNWIPIESNPEVLTKYIRKLGVSNEWEIVDVVGLEPDMLFWIPRPVKAVIMLFPCSEAYEKHREEEHERMLAEPLQQPKDIFYMKQANSNACGTVAIIHSIANNDIPLADGVLKNFLDKAKDLNPEERGNALMNDETFTASHQALAAEGQTTPDPDVPVYHHFVALVNKNDEMYELDGRKSFPIKHGATSENTFLEDAAKVCREFMMRDPTELQFVIMALVSSE